MDANLFSEGAIYYYENRTNSKKDYSNENLNHDFIVSRPVYILDANPVPFDVYTVNILTITSSSNRVGIPININGYRDGKILPYAVHSVHKEYLTRYLGQVSNEMKEMIKLAVQYHLGYSKEIPQYIHDYEESEKNKSELIKSLSKKELGVYNLIQNRCVFRDIYFTRLEEFFEYYKSRVNGEKYTRRCDITKCLTKLSKLYVDVRMDVDANGTKIIKGLSINGRVHREELPTEPENPLKGIVSDNATEESSLDVSEMTRDQLLEHLNEEQRDIYDKMDVTQKIHNYHKNPDKYNFKVVDHHNGRIIKRLIDEDIDKKKNAILNQLKQGENPYHMSHINQFIIFNMSDNEIQNNVSKKYWKKGVPKLRSGLKQNINYLFRRRF